MGMAASQARYLALTARKTNTEYEGQQINQARTALANQSANLFNQLLGLEVPVAPKTGDFTELQYSYSDGQNESVIDSWEQLSTADPDYNYIVNRYYYANKFTGAQRLLNDPQVQTRAKGVSQDWTDIALAKGYNTNPTPVITVGYQDGVAKILVDGQEVPTPPEVPYKSITNVTKDNNLTNALQDLATVRGTKIDESKVYGYQDENKTWHFIYEEDTVVKDYFTQYKPTFVGNCELTELETLTLDQQADLLQIMKDLPDSEFAKYCSSYFDKNGKYLGGLQNSGVYTFQMNGQNYYACELDLYNSMQTYDVYGKPIDAQEKLPYYSASYIKTRVEETNKALLETDGNGRFKSVRFEDDSVVYSLNTETVTDEAAYQDAMNEYNYKVQQYEKTIADINAKTSIIQEQDRTLELRLKQLDTEQKALSTEMDAVKKVISDNIEKTFKTFSD